MRFIGNKENLVEKIHYYMNECNVQGNSIFDVFAGTTSVSKYFKNLNYQVFTSDLLYFSYVLQRAYIVNNQELQFDKIMNHFDIQNSSLFATPLESISNYLNNIQPIEGFIFNNYTPNGTQQLKIPRMYFSSSNGALIDAIRLRIEEWKDKDLINENEYFVLIACLVEAVPFIANISGVYAAFQKKWDPRSLKKLNLKPIQFVINQKNNQSFNDNSVNLLKKVKADIFYLDPPYNQRQYAPNYHILETISKYDNPNVYGVTGLRRYEHQKSKFCNSKFAIQELDTIAKDGQFKNLVLSYNNEGIMKKNDIISVLSCYGKLEIIEFDYLRFKSNSNGESNSKKYIQEQLFILKKNE